MSRSWGLGLLQFQKLQFSESTFSAVLAWSSKLMVDDDSMGPSLHLVVARFTNFLLRKLSHEFKLTQCPHYTNFKWPYFRIAWGRVTRLGTLVVLQLLCMLIWSWPDPRSRSRLRGFWSSKNCRKMHFLRSVSSAISAWSSKVMVDYDNTGPSLQLVGAQFSNSLLRI